MKIFTDGSSRGNPGRGGWGAILVFPAGKTVIANGEKRMTNNEWVQELGGRETKTTNNRMELTAVIKALEFVSKKILIPHSSFLIHLYTDSSYVLKGASIWVHNWQKNKWKTKQKKDVLNKDLWQKFLKVSRGLKIEWKLLKGHSGIPANERCDVIATSYADGKKPKLHSGPLKNYGIDLSVVTESKRSTLHASRSTKKPYSYVSQVNGIVKTHGTWAECEKRVKGVSGAKFKKSFSVEDEKNLIALWSR
jgi:ribonuclease HI